MAPDTSAFTSAARGLFNLVNLDGLKFRHHGLGMLQAELTPDLRLHLWHPDLRVLTGYRAVHDHRFSIHSAVLHGRIQDIRYHVCMKVEDCSATLMYTPGVPVFSVVHAKAQSGTPADFAQAGWAFVARRNPVTYEAGQEYFIKRRLFHTNHVDEMTVTVIHRGDFDDEPARVLGDGGGIIPSGHEAAVARVIELAKALQVRR